MNFELKPCPFCGNVAAIWRDEKYGIYTVFCTDCNAEIKVCFSREAAVDAWNNRILPPFTPDELKEIRLMFDIGVRKLPDSRWVEIWQSIVDKCDAVLKGTDNE